jgi:membrane-bound lytic murein transglycosylase B
LHKKVILTGHNRQFVPRRIVVAATVMAWVVFGGSVAIASASLEAWLARLWPEAQALGVSRATFEAAIRGLEPDLTLPDLVIPGRLERPPGEQAECVQTPAVEWFEGNFADYEEDKKRRLGVDSTIPTRIKYKKFAR